MVENSDKGYIMSNYLTNKLHINVPFMQHAHQRSEKESKKKKFPFKIL